jgi:predicted nucleic acid-binding protein
MTNDTPVLYWDSSVFLAYINGEIRRLSTIDALLEEIERNEGRRIFTSTISRVEVAFATVEAQSATLSSQTLSDIDALWDDRSVVEVVELHDEIALGARALMREAVSRGWSLKPIDAIHFGTAQWLQADEIHTYDSGLFKFHEILGIEVREPHVLQSRLPHM